jgi:plastocyanin
MVPADTPGLVSTTANYPPTAAATPVPGGTPVTVQLTIKGDKFDPSSLTIPAGARVTLVYNDQDLDPHNFALYPSQSSSTAIFRSPVITGPVTQTYTFTAPSNPGTYYFRSDPNAGLQGILNITVGIIPLVPAPTTATAGPGVPITLTAQNMAFDTTTLTAPAGSTVVMTFVNKDNNMPHNFALYTNSTATTNIFTGEIITGPKTVTYTFTVPSKPGNYFFRCDIHPELMTGTFVVT